MRLRSLAFAGYRSFAARSPHVPDRSLECLKLAPLTILLGKNNGGKSTTARLLHHALLALGHDGKDPFPMTDGRRTYGTRFRDVQHNGIFFNPLDLDIALSAEDGAQTTLVVQLNQSGDSADDRPPVVESCHFGSEAIAVEGRSVRGLLPDVPEARAWREGAKKLLDASCHLGPWRDPVRPTYDVPSQNTAVQILPESHEAVARMLLSDLALRTAVGDWMAEHLDRWRVEVQQNLGVFSLLTKRPGRESNLAAAGQGIQQVLPVAVLCCWRKRGCGSVPFLDIIEQPELHLHDAAHAPLGDLLLSAVASGAGNVVVETHSESLVLRVRRRVAEGLSPDQVALVYVEDTGEGSRLRPIALKPNGDVEGWPEGVFSEAFVEVKAIGRAQRARKGA